jgi:SET domain-containing protein
MRRLRRLRRHRLLITGQNLRRYTGQHDCRRPVEGHTFLFGLSDGSVIDGSRGGNSARWLNHACAPNCETIEDQGRIFIHTLRAIEPGEELFIEYLLAIDDPPNEEVRAQYACRCAASGCRQSMLADAA